MFRQLNELKISKEVCEFNATKTTNIARIRNRQLFKCNDQLKWLQRLRIDKFKNLLDNVYNDFVDLIYSS
jgi:hypothetical protein